MRPLVQLFRPGSRLHQVNALRPQAGQYIPHEQRVLALNEFMRGLLHAFEGFGWRHAILPNCIRRLALLFFKLEIRISKIRRGWR